MSVFPCAFSAKWHLALAPNTLRPRGLTDRRRAVTCGFTASDRRRMLALHNREAISMPFLSDLYRPQPLARPLPYPQTDDPVTVENAADLVGASSGGSLAALMSPRSLSQSSGSPDTSIGWSPFFASPSAAPAPAPSLKMLSLRSCTVALHRVPPSLPESRIRHRFNRARSAVRTAHRHFLSPLLRSPHRQHQVRSHTWIGREKTIVWPYAPNWCCYLRDLASVAKLPSNDA